MGTACSCPNSVQRHVASMAELVLNLFWIALALPAYWLWRRQSHCVPGSWRISSWQCILVLGCILMLLFPVVSATDDLHFIRPESEELSRTRRVARAAANDRIVNWVGAGAPQPAILLASSSTATTTSDSFLAIAVNPLLPVGRSLICFGTRAPPAALSL